MIGVASLCAGIAAWLLTPAGSLPRVAPSFWWLSAGAKPGAPAARTRAAAGLAAAIVVLVVAETWLGPGTVVVAGLMGLGVFVASGRFERAVVVRQREAVALALPDTLDLLAAVIDSGAPLRTATERVAEVCDAATSVGLHEVLARLQVGITDADAWRALADDSAWGDAARDLARSAESGTSVSEILRAHAHDARARRHEMLEKRAKTVGVRCVGPLVCCYLPAFILTGVVPILAGVVGGFLGGR